MVTKAITSAMAAQLDRVNMSEAHIVEKLQMTEQANEHLRQRVKAMQARINALELETADLHRRLREGAPTEHMRNGRPVLTPEQASKQTGIKLHTVYRYLRSGWWKSEHDNGRYVVYADQPLNKKPRKPRSK